MLLTPTMLLTAAWVVVGPVVAGPTGTGLYPQAQEPSAASAPRELGDGTRGVDAEFLFNYYDQDGDHSPVTGGIGTEALRVLAPVVITRWQINDRWALNASLGLDQITSASTDNIDDDVSSASRVDVRAYTTVEFEREFDTQTIGLSGGFSNEYDYNSVMAGFRWTRDFNLKNTTVAASVRYFSDRLQLIGIDGSRGDDDDSPWTQRQTTDLSLSLTQLFGRRTVGTLEASMSLQRGFLSTPFHEVVLAASPGVPSGTRVAERMPDTRDRRALGARVNHAVMDWLVERLGYRYYNDTFGVTAHSVEAETHIRVSSADEMWVFPIVRFHRQTGSDYFGLPGTQTIDTEFFTADWDLSAFDSWQYGGGWRWIGAGGGKLSALPFRSVESRFTVYDRDDGLRAFVASVALGWGF